MPPRRRQQVPPIGREQEEVDEQEEMTQRARGGEEVDEQEKMPRKAKGGSDMRFATTDIMNLRHSMSEQALDRLKQLGFKDCLEISLFSIGCRDFIRSLVTKCKVVKSNGQSYILFDMDPENPRYLTAEAISVILGAPKGTDSNTKPREVSKKLGPLLREMYELSPKDPITVHDILEVAEHAKDIGDVDFEVMCFLMLLFNGLLMPSTSLHISSRSMAYAEDLESIGKYDLPKLALDNIADSLDKNKKSVYNPATLLMFLLDIIDWNHPEDGEPVVPEDGEPVVAKVVPEDGELIVPRVNFYTTEMVLKRTANLDLEKIKFKPWNDTVYAKKGVEQPQIQLEENNVQAKKVSRKRTRQDARKEDKRHGKRTMSKEKECAEDGTSVSIPLLKDFLNIEVLPGNIQSEVITFVDEAQQELASELGHVIKDYVISRAKTMASQFQALLDPNPVMPTESAGPVAPHPVMPNPLDVESADTSKDEESHQATPQDVDPNVSADNSYQATPEDVDASVSAGSHKDEEPMTPHQVNHLDDRSPFHLWDHTGHPVIRSRDIASLPAYPFISFRLANIDQGKVPYSAARFLSSSRKRKCSKVCADKWPETCKRLSQSFIDVATKKKEQETEEKQPGTEEETKRTEEERDGQNIPMPRRMSTRSIYSKFAAPPYASPLFSPKVVTKEMITATINHLHSCGTVSEELINIRGVSISRNTLISLTNDKIDISMDFIRAFIDCKRYDNKNGPIFFFLPQSSKSIEDGALEKDFQENNSGPVNKLKDKYQLAFIPVFASDGSMLVFHYSKLHHKFGFLSCNNSMESWDECLAMREDLFERTVSILGTKKCGEVHCLRKGCRIPWKKPMDEISDGNLLCLLFLECYFGGQHWLEEGMITNGKRAFVRYLLYHKLNKATLPMEFNDPLAKPQSKGITKRPQKPTARKAPQISLQRAKQTTARALRTTRKKRKQ